MLESSRMKKIPDSVFVAWEERDPLVVLTTVGTDAEPNSIYVGVTGRYDETTFFLMNSSFQKTEANIAVGSRASLLFLTKTKKAYQLKGEISLLTEGEIFDAMMAVKPEQYTAKSVAVLRVDAVFSGAEQLF